MDYKMTPAIGNLKAEGLADDAVRFLIEKHYSDPKIWSRFVEQFRNRDDAKNAGWRGEYWGKSMRSAVLLYKHLPSDALYRVLTDSVRDMISVGIAIYDEDTEMYDLAAGRFFEEYTRDEDGDYVVIG